MQKLKKHLIIPALYILRVMRKWCLSLSGCFLSFLLWNCANQTTPMGGPKDETPPRLLKSSPSHKQKNFKGKDIELVFDEAVNLNNPKDEILISPASKQEITFKVKRNTITLSPKEGWKENTTYSISFREGIRDITENNAPQNLKLAFSTGPMIDSMLVKGRVKMALNTKIPEKITVALYESDTFNIFEHTPSYFTLIDKKATYSLENIKSGKYYIYAFQDNNKNLKVESRTEKFAFLANPIDLTSPIDSLILPLISLDMRPLSMNSIRNTAMLTKLKFNKSIIDYKIKTEGNLNLINSFGDDQTEIAIYNPEQIKDSLKVSIHSLDSIGSSIDSVFYIKQIKDNSIPTTFSVTSNSIEYNLKTNQVIQEFKFTKPLKHINFDSVFIKLDSLNKIPITEKDIYYDPIYKKLNIKKSIHFDSLFKKPVTIDLSSNKIDGSKEVKSNIPIRKTAPSAQTQPELILAKGTFISQESDTLKPLKFPITETNKASTGTLLVEVTTDQPNYIIQLITTEGKVIEQVANVKKYAFEYLSPRNYKIMVIIDKNNNGKWDPGNYFNRVEPEPTWFYKTQDKKYDFPIRANWELGPIMLIF